MNEERRELNVDYWMGSHSADGSPPLKRRPSKCPRKKAMKKVQRWSWPLTLSSTTMNSLKNDDLRWEIGPQKVREELVKGETVNSSTEKREGSDVGL
jgi:hypothetical protein